LRKIVVAKLIYPVRRAQAIERILKYRSERLHVELLSNPVFMAERIDVAKL